MPYASNIAAVTVPTSEPHVLERSAAELLDFLTRNLPEDAQVTGHTVTPVQVTGVTNLLVTILWQEKSGKISMKRAASC